MIKTFVFRVKGVTFENRQPIIARMTGKEPCRIEPEPDNAYDPNALAVIVVIEGQRYKVGFVPREKAAEIAPKLAGENVIATIKEITGGFVDRYGEVAARGLIVEFEYPADENPLAYYTDNPDEMRF